MKRTRGRSEDAAAAHVVREKADCEDSFTGHRGSQIPQVRRSWVVGMKRRAEIGFFSVQYDLSWCLRS